VRGCEFTPDKRDEFKETINLYNDLKIIHQDYSEKKGIMPDLFGDYLEYVNALNPKTGQFFTPQPITDFMAVISFVGLNEDQLKGEPRRFSDPCCGTGRFMLATAKYYARQIGCFNFVYHNTDIDFKCFVSTALNAILNYIPSVNIWGDSLTNKVNQGIIVLPHEREGLYIPEWRFLTDEQINNLSTRFFDSPDGKKTIIKNRVAVPEMRVSPAKEVSKADLFAGIF
jgi:hypothetical protein